MSNHPANAMNAPGQPKRILIAEDETAIADLLQLVLESQGYEVVAVNSGDAAFQLLRGDYFSRTSCPFDLLWTDVVMPGMMSGIDLLSFVRGRYPNLPVIVSSGYCFGDELFQLGATQVHPKPLNPETILKAVEACLLARHQHHHQQALTPESTSPGPKTDAILIETTGAFIHKLNNEFTALDRILKELRQSIAKLGEEDRTDFAEPERKLSELLASIRYLFQRFRNTMGRHPGTLRPIDLRKVLIDVQEHCKKRFTERLTMKALPENCKVGGDYELLWHLFENLIRNGLEAVAGQDTGQVTVTISAGAHQRQLEVVVQDNGPGIPEKDLPHLFSLNYTTKPKGLGVGLYLVRRAAEIHGGQVECQSALGKGTTFRVTLPLFAPA